MSEIREVPAGKVVGVKTSFFTIMNQEKYDPRAIPSAWQAFFEKYRGSGLSQTNSFYGAVVPSDSMDIPMTYVAGVLVDSSVEVPSEFDSIEISGGDYFCFTHHGAMTDIAPSYQKAYGIEFPALGREMRPDLHLEIYESDKDPMDPDYEFIIAIPVK